MKPAQIEVKNAWAVAWRIVVVLFLVIAFITAIFHYSAADVRAVCLAHGGVTQIADNTFGAGPDKASVVCRDGYVGDVS